MIRFFWKLRYALIMRNRIKPTIRALWANATDAWADNQGIDTPLVAVNNVIGWDGSARQNNAEVDQAKDERNIRRERKKQASAKQSEYKH
jgi:hypothetical protein